MAQFIAFSKAEQEEYEGRKIMTDPGVHRAVAAEVENLVAQRAKILDIGAGAGAFSLRLHKMGYDVRAAGVDDSVFDIPKIKFRKVQVVVSVIRWFSTGPIFG